ncbi:MAG TPA: alkyl hydroperoxide reductase [Microscillaceae bacterium]|nr:alkyl hydroperoxide reductase [Microscillaceae bacterium]
MTLQTQLTQVREATLAHAPQSAIESLNDSIAYIKTSKLEEQALQPGQVMPDFQLVDVHGIPQNIRALHTNDFLILNFYRGEWCPYCNLELRAYEQLRSDFLALGADIVAISAEKSTLGSQTADKNALSYPVLTDKDAQMMKAIGIVFQLDEASKREYQNFGLDLQQIQGNDHYELPVPAIYVLNKEMEVVFRHFEADYTTRLEPSDLLTILKNQSLVQAN